MKHPDHIPIVYDANKKDMTRLVTKALLLILLACPEALSEHLIINSAFQ